MKIILRSLSGSLFVAGALSCCTKLESASDTFGSGHILVGSAAASGAGGGGNPVGGAPAVGGFGGFPGPGFTGGTHGGRSTGGETSGGEGGEGGGGAGAGGGEGSECIDETGFNGAGCYRCAATDIVSLERACTTAQCTGFDNAGRLTHLSHSGKLPPLPSPSSGEGGASGAGGMSDGALGGKNGVSGSTSGGGASGSTSAGFACGDLAQTGTLVYVTGSSASKPFLQQIAQQLAGEGIFVVYTATGSCVGVDAVVNGTLMTSGPAPAPAGAATYWEDSSSSGKACDLPVAGVSADLGISDVFAQTCPGFELADLDAQDIRDAHGPIQTMTFVVPANSPYSEISAQAAYFVFGFGADGGVLDPLRSKPIWDDESLVFQRGVSSGTQSMIASAIGVPAGSWLGKPHKTSDDLAADLESALSDEATAEKAIGILAADYIDTKNLRAQIKVLAFEDTHAPCAVLPDSAPGARDKQNVRDGHYPIWGPLHLLYKVDQAGNPLNEANRQAVSDIVGYLSGTKALPNGVKLLDVYAQSGLVPECAMRVTRVSDGGDLTPRVPSNPCACSFELRATGSTSCAPCTVQGDCARGETCSQGYCEK